MFPLIVSGQILELPYEGKELSMIIMLPNEIEDDTTGLEKVRHVNFSKNAHLKNEKDESQIISVISTFPCVPSWRRRSPTRTL